MSYNILGINPFHNGSVCVLSDGEVVYFLEEERLTRYKHDANPFRIILEVLQNFKIDEVIVAGINTNNRYLNYSNECPFLSLIRKTYHKIPAHNISDNHHLTHLYHSYANSGFKECLGVVIDAGGSSIGSRGVEQDSIYKIKSSKITPLYKNLLKPLSFKEKQGTNIASAYDCITQHLGFKKNEEGKTMGLSSYGSFNSKFPSFFENNNRTNPNFIFTSLKTDKKTPSPIVYSNFTLSPPKSSKIENKISQEDKDLAWRIQNDTQQLVGDYIEKYTKETGLKQVCCSGGYFLNCVANYYLIKRFPNIEFYFEPVSHDGGTAIGAAKLLWYEKTQNTTITPQKTLYYGPKYSKEELLEGIKKYT